MLRIFLPHFSILGGQHLPDCHKKQLSKSTEKSNFLPEAGGQLGPDYPPPPKAESEELRANGATIKRSISDAAGSYLLQVNWNMLPAPQSYP